MLKYSDQQILAKALKGASTEVQDKIFRNMSKSTSSMLKEDLEYMGPITFAETEEAKSQILQTLLKLEKERKLKINSLIKNSLNSLQRYYFFFNFPFLVFLFLHL